MKGLKWHIAKCTKEDLPDMVVLMVDLFRKKFTYELHMGYCDSVGFPSDVGYVEYRFVFKRRFDNKKGIDRS